MKKFFILLLLAVLSASNFAQECSINDRQTFIQKMEQFSGFPKNLSLTEIIGKVGRTFIGTEYTASTLEVPGKEHLVVFFNNLDCTTFLETTVALSQSVLQSDSTFTGYTQRLTALRYRNGIINEYPSRLHYFSDWLYDNIKKGIVEDRTKAVGGEKIQFAVNFMSTHPESYKQLKENPDFVTVIKQQEAAINARTYWYIPKEKVAKMQDKINEGDLIAITTNIKGLDIGHVGIAVKEQGVTKFLHAPLVGSKVQISSDDLAGYLAKIKKHTGIIVFKVK